jgi:enoyl-CoA hydratase
MNETAIGLTLPRFAIELARHRLTPPGFARVSSGAMFPPEEAQRLGYLDRVVEAGALAAAVDEEAARLHALDRKAFAATEARTNEQARLAIQTAVDAELPAR